jgi:hypothetical protein
MTIFLLLQVRARFASREQKIKPDSSGLVPRVSRRLKRRRRKILGTSPLLSGLISGGRL